MPVDHLQGDTESGKCMQLTVACKEILEMLSGTKRRDGQSLRKEALEIRRELIGRVSDQCQAKQVFSKGWRYSDAGRALFDARPVTTPMAADIYSPSPGQTRVFVRTKVARIERLDDRVRLLHSMHDNVHGFEVTYEVEIGTGRIVRAESVTSRLPYAGICSEPQRRIAGLLAETLDAGLGKRIQGHVGGVSGCAQLYDLTADLLRLLAR